MQASLKICFCKRTAALDARSERRKPGRFVFSPAKLEERRASGEWRGAALEVLAQHDGALVVMRGPETLARVPGELFRGELLMNFGFKNTLIGSSKRAESPSWHAAYQTS